ncbi:MAG: hypothetical protein AAB442_03140 [Patescibacteria group bacterium]
MKRFLVAALFITSLAVFASAPLVHAETFYDAFGNEYPTKEAASAADAKGNAAAQAALPAAQNTPTPNPPPLPDPNDGTKGVMGSILSMFAWLVGVAALALDAAVYYTVVTMGNYVSQLSAVGVTWRILRDIANIMFIFGFLGVGIATILNVEKFGWGKKMLPMLVVGAVFLNFSLFITEAVIDGTNLFATQFYTQINGGKPAGKLDFDSVAPKPDGIAGKILSQIGLAQVYNSGRINTKVFDSSNSILVFFMGIILFLVTAFVLFSLAFILIARFVALIFYIILSPVGFMGLALPQMQARAAQWWSKFFEQAITAPILMLLLYVALAVITDASFLKFGNTSPNWTGFVPKADGSTELVAFAGTLLSFLVGMGLLLVVVIKAKSMSAFGAKQAGALAGKLTFGLTAVGLRTGVGMPAQYLSRKVRSSNFGATKTGRIFAQTLDRGAKASFDLRGTSALSGADTLKFDAGKPQEGGYRARQEKSVKEHQAYADSLQGNEKKENTREQNQQIKQAEIKLATAQFARNDAALVNKKATEELALHKSELEAIEAEKKKDKYWVTDPKNEQRLEAAQKAVADSEIASTTATKNLTTAEEELAAAIKGKKETVDKIDAANKNTIGVIGAKERREQYAENIKGPFFGSSIPGWALFGPGGGIAAKKIKTAKPPKDQLFDLITKAAKEAEGPAPAPATTPAAPAAGSAAPAAH